MDDLGGGCETVETLSKSRFDGRMVMFGAFSDEFSAVRLARWRCVEVFKIMGIVGLRKSLKRLLNLRSHCRTVCTVSVSEVSKIEIKPTAMPSPVVLLELSRI